MARKHKSRAGSMAFSPRKRAKRDYPRVRSWPTSSESKLLGFAGYKAGMTHMLIKDNTKDTSTSGKDVFTPVTVLECPPIVPISIRAYKKTNNGLQISGEFSTSLPKNSKKILKRKISLPDKEGKEKELKGDKVSVLVHTKPKSATGKKKPEIFEIAVGGESFEDQLNYAKEILGKEINITDIFKEGEYIDVSAITKGKGTQGPVKRFGIRMMKRKQKVGKKRHVGTLGDRRSETRWTVPMAGQMGFHSRTEFNKWVVKLGEDGAKITPKSGFVNYGKVENNFIALKGSVPGSTKRLVRLRPGMRAPKPKEPDITYVSLASKQSR
ncbi:MAG: 50S ribosomal protein L3 [Candidatus Undinarchaeales archaeon]